MQKSSPSYNPKINVSEESKDFLRKSMSIDEETRLSIKDLDVYILK